MKKLNNSKLSFYALIGSSKEQRIHHIFNVPRDFSLNVKFRTQKDSPSMKGKTKATQPRPKSIWIPLHATIKTPSICMNKNPLEILFSKVSGTIKDLITKSNYN